MKQEIENINHTFVQDVKNIIEQGRNTAYQAVNRAMIETYWHIGRRIVEEEQNGSERAKYGEQLINQLSVKLTNDYGTGFSARYLRAFRKFYIIMPDLEIWKSRFPNLTWTHVFRSLRVGDEAAIRWYLETAAEEMWSIRTLDRNISTQYFERHFKQPQLPVKEEQPDKLELLKNPIVAEFLGFKQDNTFSEIELETAIITHLQDFIMELGRGFAFVKRQQLIRTEAKDYFIDLVFYNVIHQDVGQMDMYRRMYDELKRTEGDNPTIGIVLCSDTDADIAKYSILNGNEQLFAAKYLPLLPTKEELKREIERQKTIFALQQGKEQD